MKYLMIIALFLVGCSDPKKPVETKKVGDYNVSLLFEHEGCKVYRFYDEGRERYYTNCTETISSYTESHGKTSTEHDENIRGKHGN